MPSDEDPLARVVGARAPALAAAAQGVTDGLANSCAPDAAIIGNVNVDILLWPAGAVPPPGQEWIIETAHVRPGGAAANAALTMAGLGARPRLIGCVGDDSLGRDLIASLARAGIGHEVAVIAGTQTGVSVAFQAPGRDRSFLMALGSLARFGVADIPADAAASARLLLCGYFTLPLLRGQPTADLLATARAAGTMTFLDPGWDPRGWPPEVRAEITTLLPLVDVFLPNAQEASALTGIENPGLAARAIRGSGSNAVIVKLGAAGCLALGPDGRELRVPAPAVTVTDATGAGDALNGALMSALAAGASWEDAVSFSVRAASAVAARPSHARYPRMADVPNVPPNGDLWPISRADHAAYTDQAARSEGEAGVAAIGLERLTKVFADGTRAVSDLDLDIPDGCLMVLVGPSGCGKTTVLRMVAGLEQVTDGEVRIGERAVTRLAAKDRDVAMVFQNYALYPQMTAYQNMAFALRLRKLVRPEVDRRVREAARVLGIEDLLGKKPRHLSGGQRQRVAMGRAIVREPRAFLMDEPLSNLDAKLRVQMRAEISRIQQRLGTTTIYVTHDQVEAMTIGHLVAVMSAGELQQVGTPQEIYGCPANVFVATFIGSPSMNLVAASLRASDGEVWADFADSHLRLPTPTLAEHPGLAGYVGRNLILGLRPEHMQETAGRGQVPADRCIHATVEHREVMGAEAYLHVSLAGQNVPGAEPAPEEDAGGASLSGAGVPFVARVAGTSPAAVGDKIDIAVDATNLYFFDPGSQHVIAA